MRELTRDYAVETVGTSSPFPESRRSGAAQRLLGSSMPVADDDVRGAATARRHRPVAEVWIAKRPGRGLIGVADLGRRQ